MKTRKRFFKSIMAMAMALALVMGVGGVGVGRVEAEEEQTTWLVTFNIIEGDADAIQCDYFVKYDDRRISTDTTWGELKESMGTPIVEKGHTFKEWVLVDGTRKRVLAEDSYKLDQSPSYMVYAL